MAYDGTLHGAPSFVSAASGFGQALSLDGATQYATVPVNPGPCDVASSGSITVEARVKTSSGTGTFVIAGSTDGTAAHQIFLAITNGFLRANVGTQVIISTTNAVADGAWHSVALVVSGGAIARLFVDGALVQTVNPIGGTWSGTAAGATAYLGGWTSSANDWPGQIDEVSLSAAALYSATYTPAATPFPNVRVNQTALYHLDGDAHDSNTVAPPPPTAVGVGDTAWFFSPYNWDSGGPGPPSAPTYRQTQAAGAYCKVGFSGTACVLDVDTTPLAALPSGSYPSVRYSVDDGPWQDVQLQPAMTRLFFLAGLADGPHTLLCSLLNLDYNQDLWNGPTNVLRITGLHLDAGATALPPAPSGPIGLLPRRLLLYGDSITAGLGQERGDDATTAFGPALAAALGAELGAVGYGGLGWARNGRGNVAMLWNSSDAAQSWNKYAAGRSRLVGGLLAPRPDYIVVVLGTNDGLNNVAPALLQATVQGFLGQARAAAPGVPIALCVPFGGFVAATLAAAVAALRPQDPQVVLINLGVPASAGLAGPQGTASQQSVDSIHPRSVVHGRLGAMLAAALLTLPAAHAPEDAMHSTLLISDREVSFDAQNVPAPFSTGRVRAAPTLAPLWVQDGPESEEDQSAARTATLDRTTGAWSLVLPWPSICTPATVQFTLQRSTGATFVGSVPEGVAGPLTVWDLVHTYGWSLVATSVTPAPVSAIGPPTGLLIEQRSRSWLEL